MRQPGTTEHPNVMEAPKHSLELKISSLILIILTVGLGSLMYLIITRQTRAMMDGYREKSEMMAASVVKSIQNVMVAGRADIAVRLVQDLKTIHGLERLQIFRTDGRGAFHTLDTFEAVKRHLGSQPGGAETIRVLEEGIRTSMRLRAGSPETIDRPQFQEVIRSGRDVSFPERVNDMDSLTYLKPLVNEPRCYGCHGSEHPIRGVVVLSSSLEPMQAEIARSRRTLVLWSVLTMVLVAVALRFALKRIVLEPLSAAVGGIREIAGGNLLATVPVKSQDEIGVLAANLNKCVVDLRQSQELLVRTEKLSSLGRLASGVAHEINNPLASIAGYAEDLRERLASRHELSGEDLERLRGALQTIERQVDRCRAITKNLLNFARKEEGARTQVDLNAVAEETARLVEFEARNTGVRIGRKLDPGLPSIVCDPGQIQQIVLNLVRNALDATGPGGEVTIGTATDPAGIRVTVADTGCGIPPEHLDKIFDPFFTTKPPGKGTGLGLSISYALVESLGGQISVQSSVGRGTMVTVTLPAAADGPVCVPHRQGCPCPYRSAS